MPMQVIDPVAVLRRAEEAFAQGRYEVAMRLYSEVLAAFPRLSEAKVGVYLSDLALENAAEASALFDFYYIIKEQVNAATVIEEIVDAMMQLSQSTSDATAIDPSSQEMAEGIGYRDFIELVETRDNFKETFEDILFSTKVIITSKAEFIDFVTRLAKEGMVETALKYLDASGGLFGNDQEVLALYGMVNGGMHGH